MTIVVDTREPDGLVYELADLVGGGSVRTEALDTGDILTDEYIIERKRYDDFVNSMTTSEANVWDQMLATSSAAEDMGYEPVILLEGNWQHTFRYSGVSKEAVTKAIASMFALDCSVVHTFSKTSTATFVARLDTDGGGHSVQSIRDSPSVPDELIPRYLVEGLPGVGPTLAERLLDEFGTPAAVFAASASDLTTVSGIGEKTAASIVDATHATLQ